MRTARIRAWCTWCRSINQDQAGAWQPIDTSLAAGSGGRWDERANSLAVSAGPAASDQALASLGLPGGGQVSAGLAGTGAVAGVAAGSSVGYGGALPGTDVAVSGTADGWRITLRLSSAAAARAWTFPLTTAGLTPQLAVGGGVDFVTASGGTAAEIGPGYAADSAASPGSGLPAVSPPVTYQLATTPGGTTPGGTSLAASLDQAWLADPARVFPVTVALDLKAVVAAAGSSATRVLAGNLAVAPDGPVVAAGSFGHGADSAAAVFRFPSFPGSVNGQRITSASLHVFGTTSQACGSQPLRVAVLAGTGSQAVVPGGGVLGDAAGAPPTASCGPAAGDTPAAAPPAASGKVTPAMPGTASPSQLGAGAAAGPVTATGLAPGAGSWQAAALPVTAITQAAASGATLALAPPAGTASGGQLIASAASANAPYLMVTAAAPSGIPQIISQYPLNNYNSPTLAPELLATGLDADGDTVQFVFTIYDHAGNQVATSGLLATGDWDVPAGKLAWNQTYYWAVWDFDGTNYSPAPQASYLSTPVPQPLVTSSLSQDSGGHGFSAAAGDYTTSATDARIATVGPALNVDRSYNSLDPRVSGAFGAGWSSVLDMKVTPGLGGGSGTMNVTYPDGQEVGFGLNPNGSFTAPMGRYATLVSVTGGGYTLTDKNDTVYRFGQSLGGGAYGVTSVADALGRALSFTYNAASPPQVTQVTAASGRALHLTWSIPAGASSAHVAAVVTDAVTAGNPASALTWQYSYTGDQLAKVCPPASATACAAYSYTGGSVFPATVLDSGPHSYWRLGEAAGAISAASSVAVNEGTDNAAYVNAAPGQPGPLPGSPATSAGFNGTSSYVAMPGSLVTGSSFQSISMWFKTTSAGETLFSYSHDPIGSLSTPGAFTPALYVGNSGVLHAEFWNGKVDPVATSTPVNDGKWHFVVLAATGDSQTLYLDGKPLPAVAGAVKMFGNQNNNYAGAGFLGGYWPDAPNDTAGNGVAYPNFFSGSISDIGYWDRTVTSGEAAQMYAAGTGQANLMTQAARFSGKVRAQAAYAPLTGAVSQVTDENGGVWQVAAPSVTGSSQVYAGSVLGQGPADYWRLAETGTTQAVNQVHGGTANLSNVTEQAGAGPFADTMAPSFNGTSSYIALPNGLITGNGNQSVSLWFKTTATGAVMLSSSVDPLANGTTGHYTPELYVGNDGKLEAEFWMGAGTPIATTTAVNDGKWHNVLLSAGISSQVLYLDGKQVGTPLSGTIGGTGQNYVYVGAGFVGGTWPSVSDSLCAGIFPVRI